jgi:hypothetical protein
MIQANELRLGNLILKNNEIHEISSLFFVDLHDGTIRENYNNSYIIEPIPLTEEWFLKFGFRTEETYCFELDDISINTKRELMWVFTKCKNNVELEFPKYVHELQNLYFALTNNELEIL